MRIVPSLSDIPKVGVCAEGYIPSYLRVVYAHHAARVPTYHGRREAYTRRRTPTMGGEAPLCASLITHHGVYTGIYTQGG